MLQRKGGIINVNAFDPNGDRENGNGLMYSITGGADAEYFNIDPYSGSLYLNLMPTIKLDGDNLEPQAQKVAYGPDFENPMDANGDNVYEVQVTVTDSTEKTGSQNIAVTVTDAEPSISDQEFMAYLPLQNGETIGYIDLDHGSDFITEAAFTEGNTGNAFTVDSYGEIEVNDPFEEPDEFNLTLEYSDGITTKTATITINVVDED